MGPQPFRSSPLRVGGSLKNGCQDPRMAVKKRKLLCIPQGEEFAVLSQKGTERRMMRGTEKKRGAGTIGRSQDWVGVKSSGRGQLKVVCINAKRGSLPFFSQVYKSTMCCMNRVFLKIRGTKFYIWVQRCKSVYRARRSGPTWQKKLQDHETHKRAQQLLSTTYYICSTYSDKPPQNYKWSLKFKQYPSLPSKHDFQSNKAPQKLITVKTK